jgi:DNA-binding response OmpR family regulator
MDVVLVRWPAEQPRRERLRAEGGPRLLLVEGGSPPPPPGDDALEDWIRVPADDADVQHRLAGLEARARARSSSLAAPELDDDGVLRVGGAWVSLPPVEARLTSAFLARLGLVVSREALARAGWPDGAPGRNALDVHVLRLRRRLVSVSLVIRTVRSRGYLLEQEKESVQQDVQEA